MSFTNDLFIFSGFDIPFITSISSILDHFSKVTGMQVNEAKSKVVFSGIDDVRKAQVVGMLRFHEAALPVKYLGGPLISTRLKKEHCSGLVDKIMARINSWTKKFLSYTGRLQLVVSVLHSIHVFWCQIFILPAAALKGIDQ